MAEHDHVPACAPGSSIKRRTFIAMSAATAVGLTARRARAAKNERLGVAFIAVGGRGGADMGAIAKDPNVDVIAICDVNHQHLDRVSKQYPNARAFADFRKLYEGKTDDFDAVVVATPEHTHPFATMPALKLGKHVYCEKPLTHDVAEARAITKAAADAKVVTQMGTQIHAGNNYHAVVELIQSGAIGPVREAHVWVSRAWGLQSPEDAKKNRDIVSVQERPKEPMTPPDFVDWDLWIGPAPMRPYHDVYFPGPKWYRWWDFGNGTMSDLGSHWIDLPFWALQLDAPVTIEAFGDKPHPEIAPASMSVEYHYNARKGVDPQGNAVDLPACKVHWYQGAHKPTFLQERGVPTWGNGVLFIGDKGMLLSDYGKHVLLPEADFKDFKAPAPFTQRPRGHHEEWLDAIRNGTPTGSPFSYAGPLTEANHLGNVAFRVGKKLEWDTQAMRATNAPEADQYLRRTPRTGWSL
ncbi:MAG: gfo/Idh/MocA family oxidoreductase [Phycisphaera sp.]|nr:gfo/Idh/MocA family oxidoreductase [Phycisphaera sp.]